MFDKWRKLYKRHQNIRLQKMLWIHQHQSDTLRRVSMFTLKIWTARREQINWASPLLHTPRSMVDGWSQLTAFAWANPVFTAQPCPGWALARLGWICSINLPQILAQPPLSSRGCPWSRWTAHILQGAAAFVRRLKKWGKTERKQGAEDSLG